MSLFLSLVSSQLPYSSTRVDRCTDKHHNTNKRPQHLFSYTETEREVSLILDESHIAGFPEDTLDVCNVIWRAVEIEPGESGLGKICLPPSFSLYF